MKKLIYDTYYYWFKIDGKHNLRDFIQFVKAVKINKMEDCTMSIKITKTPQQAELENRTKRVDNICPCCGHKEPFGTYYLKGLFVIKEVHCYKCRNCGCEWEVEEKL